MIEQLEIEIKNLKKENEQLKTIITDKNNQINDLKNHLSKYTNPERYKKYYDENKQKIIEKQKLYNKLNYDTKREEILKKKKEYYQKKKNEKNENIKI